MIPSRRPRLNAIGIAAICGLFFLPLPSWGRGEDLNLTGASNCTAVDLDAYVHFINGPGDYYTIVVDKSNISSRECIFDGPLYGPSVAPDRVPGNPPFTLCYDCENRLPNGQYPVRPTITVRPGQAARQTFRWKTAQQEETRPCLQPDWMSGPVMIVARSLLKRICSDIEVSRFSLADKPESTLSEGETADAGQASRFKLATGKNAYYERQQFVLHVSLNQPIPQTSTGENNCPTLYLRQRSPDGTTRFDEIEPLAFEGCGKAVLGHEPGDWRSGFDLDSGAYTRWDGLGEHTMQVFQLAGSLESPQLEFFSSNLVRIQIADAAAIQRKWGGRVKGVAADVTLDKDTFRLGEDVPLHLAIANFDASVPVYSWDPLWDPCLVVGIEVRDSGGHRLSTDEMYPNWSICTGHGLGLRPFAKGKIVPLERTLGGEGWLPKQPGTYTVVITWAPCAGSPTPSGIMKPYAVVKATASFHIVAATLESVPEKRGGLNGSTQHSPEVLSAGVSIAKFVRER